MIDKAKNRVLHAAKGRAIALQALMISVGADHRCPVCGHRVKIFQALPQYHIDSIQKHGCPYVGEQLETCNYRNYSCPFCWASDRDRLYALYVQQYLASVGSDGVIRMLDIAPSPPLSHFIRKRIARSGRNVFYRTADLNAQGVDDKVDIMDMKIYADDQYDFFICSHVLEHVDDDKKALRELYRILKPGGQGILMVPVVLGLDEIDEDPAVVDEGERWRRFGGDDHVRLYSKAGFVERVTGAGFLVHQYGKEFFGEELLTQAGITGQSVLYVVEK